MKLKIRLRYWLCGLLALTLTGCTKAPSDLPPVENFQLNSYLGKWYEIARLENRFERGLSNITANYSLRDDGSLRVINRGFDVAKGLWKQAEGKAYFADQTSQGFLQVSFFGPFYGDYVIFGLDHSDYQYSFVAGPDRSYLWLLSRTPSPSQEVIDLFLTQASAAGFDVSALIWVDHQMGANASDP